MGLVLWLSIGMSETGTWLCVLLHNEVECAESALTAGVDGASSDLRRLPELTGEIGAFAFCQAATQASRWSC